MKVSILRIVFGVSALGGYSAMLYGAYTGTQAAHPDFFWGLVLTATFISAMGITFPGRLP